jgi:hypothetical protein
MECGEKPEQKWKMVHKHSLIWKYGKNHSLMWKMRNAQCRSWSMVKKMKMAENETQTL